MSLSAFIVALLLGPAFAQVIQVGPSDPDHCYKIEKIRPNLALQEEVHIAGAVRDQTGAPFQNSQVELRKYISQRRQIRVRVVSTDGVGHFDLGSVKRGNYRLLASPNRAFKQPPTLQCRAGKNCELQITLVPNPTDQPDFSCPVR